MHRPLIVLTTVAGFVACWRSSAAQSAAPPVTIYQSERHDIGTAAATDSLPRVLYVALPSSYADSASKRYPVVYVLDGDGVFALTAGIERLLLLGRETPEAIIVGIANGRPFVETPPFRWRNFTPTAVAAHPGTGHARELLAYLAREVLPFVDSLYRTQPGDRTLVGISRSGLFVLYALYERPDVFQRYIAASPEANWDNRYLFRRDSALAVSKRTLPVSLYLSVGETELARPFGAAVREFGDTLKARHYEGMHLVVETLPGETHNSSFATAITHGLKAVFRGRVAPNVSDQR